MNRMAQDATRRAASIGFVLVAWLVASRFVGTNILPGPPEVVADLGELVMSGRFVAPLTATLSRTIVGFLAALVVGIAYGVVAARVPWFRRAAAPAITLLLFFPTLGIVLIGLIVIGTGTMLAAVVITMVGVFPTIGVYVRDSLLDLDEDILELADSFKISQWRRFIDIYLPHLTPTLLGAGRIAFNVAWKIILLAEVFGFSGGLGFQVRLAFTAYNMPVLLSWLTIFIVALLVIEQLGRVAERRVVRWV